MIASFAIAVPMNFAREASATPPALRSATTASVISFASIERKSLRTSGAITSAEATSPFAPSATANCRSIKAVSGFASLRMLAERVSSRFCACSLMSASSPLVSLETASFTCFSSLSADFSVTMIGRDIVTPGPFTSFKSFATMRKVTRSSSPANAASGISAVASYVFWFFAAANSCTSLPSSLLSMVW